MINSKAKGRLYIPLWLIIVAILTIGNLIPLDGMDWNTGKILTNNSHFSFGLESCSDGIQNGDETGIDCGGTLCEPCQTPPAIDCNPLYFVDNSESEISSIHKDGSGLTSLIQSEFLDPTLVTAHFGKAYLFIYDNGDKRIKRSDLNGGNLITVVSSGLTNIGGLTTHEADQKIYWSNWSRGEIRRSNLDGTNVETILSGLNDPGELIFESGSPNLFWIDGTNGEIWKVSLNDLIPELIVSGISDPQGIDIDELNGKIYFTDNQLRKVQRVNLDGTQPEILGSIKLTSPGSLVVDETNNKLYGTEWGQYKVFEMNLDGTGFKSLTNGGTSLPNSIILDEGSRDLIWVDQGNAAVQKSNLNGSDLTNVFTSITSFGLTSILVDHKLYWTDLSAGTINSSALDGTNHQILVFGLNTPKGIAWHGGLQKLFWVDSGTKKLQSSNLDGSDVIDILSEGMKIPNGVFVDEVNNFIYWTEIGNKTIERVRPDGSEREIVIDEGLVIPEVLIVDPFEEYIYWSDVGNSKIKRSDLDGNNIITIIANGLGLVKGMYLDRFYDKLYWTDAGKDRIEKACTNGEARSIVFELPKGSYPTGISSTDSICYEVIPGDTSQCKLLSEVFIGDENNMDWIPLEGEDGKIAAFINARGNNLGHVTSKIYMDSSDVRFVEGIPYARRDIEIIPEVDPSSSVSVRLFYTNDEIEDLLSVDEGVTTIEDLVIARDDEGCTGAYAGHGTILPPTKTMDYGDKHFYFEVSSALLGNFYLYGVGSSLATEWAFIEARANDDGIQINWLSYTDDEVLGFEIQRSQTGLDFQYLDEITIAENHGEAVSYQFMDRNPMIGRNYYRIKELTANDSENTSIIVSANWLTKELFQVFPVPVSGNLTVRAVNGAYNSSQISISDIVGRKLMVQEMKGSETEFMLQSLENGIYILRIQNEEELLYVQKIIISNH